MNLIRRENMPKRCNECNSKDYRILESVEVMSHAKCNDCNNTWLKYSIDEDPIITKKRAIVLTVFVIVELSLLIANILAA